MKTRILLLSAIAAMIVYSCSSERDDEQTSTSNKIDLKTLKTSKNNETSRAGDTIQLSAPQSAGPGSGFNPSDPNDPSIIPPGDIKPPKP